VLHHHHVSSLSLIAKWIEKHWKEIKFLLFSHFLKSIYFFIFYIDNITLCCTRLLCCQGQNGRRFFCFFFYFLVGDWTNHRMAHVQGIGRGREKNRPGMFSLSSLIVAKKKSVLLILTSGTVYCIHSNRHTSPSLLNQQSVTRSKNKCLFD
jgi:hypothetical protein